MHSCGPLPRPAAPHPTPPRCNPPRPSPPRACPSYTSARLPDRASSDNKQQGNGNKRGDGGGDGGGGGGGGGGVANEPSLMGVQTEPGKVSGAERCAGKSLCRRSVLCPTDSDPYRSPFPARQTEPHPIPGRAGPGQAAPRAEPRSAPPAQPLSRLQHKSTLIATEYTTPQTQHSSGASSLLNRHHHITE